MREPGLPLVVATDAVVELAYFVGAPAHKCFDLTVEFIADSEESTEAFLEFAGSFG
jgi:hypothetical protein